MYRTKERRYGQIALFWMVICVLLSMCGCQKGKTTQKSGVDRIVYVTNQGIYVINSDGSDKKKITEEGENIVVSPDGSCILYKKSLHYGGELHCVNIDGSGDTTLAELDSYTYGGYAVYEFFPDGSRVLFETGKTLYLINPDGTGQIVLTSGNNATFSKDGSRVYFVDASMEQTEDGIEYSNYDEGICSIRLDGTDKQVLVGSELLEGFSWRIFYSPDLDHFLIPFYDDGSGNRARITSGKGQKSEVINCQIDEYHHDGLIRFSPDGSCLLASASSLMDEQILLFDSDGRNQRSFNLSTEKISRISVPAFSPDSQSFVFCAWTEWNRGNDDHVSISRDSFGMSMFFSNSPGMGEQNIYVNPVD